MPLLFDNLQPETVLRLNRRTGIARIELKLYVDRNRKPSKVLVPISAHGFPLRWVLLMYMLAKPEDVCLVLLLNFFDQLLYRFLSSLTKFILYELEFLRVGWIQVRIVLDNDSICSEMEVNVHLFVDDSHTDTTI
jgi:hypothetical protein